MTSVCPCMSFLGEKHTHIFMHFLSGHFYARTRFPLDINRTVISLFSPAFSTSEPPVSAWVKVAVGGFLEKLET